jgi:phage baseplate assembly protein W
MESTIPNKEIQIHEFRSTREVHFVDLDLAFNAHPITGDIGILTDIDAIKRSLINLIVTSFYERPFNSAKGTRIRRSLFENISPITNILMVEDIKAVISTFEPRVHLAEVNITPSGAVYIRLTIKNGGAIEFSYSLTK